MDERKRLEVRLSGVVQGVGFRWFVAEHGRQLGLAGWVRNLPDGSVQVVAEGPREALERLLALAQRGPRHALVTGCEVQWGEPEGLEGPFGIKGW